MRRITIGECKRNGESRNILDCGGRGCPPSNKLWYQGYMQVQFAPGNCCPEICLCNQQLLQAFVQVSLAPGNCCPEICLCNRLLLQGFVQMLFAPRPLTLRGLLQFATDITSLTKCRATALTQATALNQIQAGQTMNVLTIPRLRTTKPPLNRCLVLEKAPFPSPSASRPMPGLRSFAKMEQGLLKTGQNSVIAIGVANARRRSVLGRHV